MHGFNKKTIFFQSNRKDILTSAMQSKRHVRHDMICAIIFFSYPQWLNVTQFLSTCRLIFRHKFQFDETDFCLVLSNLLENALEASLKTAKFRQRIDIKIYRHDSNLIFVFTESFHIYSLHISLYVYLFTYTSSATAISDRYTSLPHQTGYVNAPRQISG